MQKRGAIKLMLGLWAFLLVGGITMAHADERLTSQILGNGLEVIVVENHLAPLATIKIVLRFGSWVESPEQNGLTHLYEHMFFKGHNALPSQGAFLARARQLGMVWDSSINEEWMSAQFTLSSKSLSAGLDFMRQAVQYPLVDEDELNREKQILIGEIARKETVPTDHLSRAVAQQLWGADFYHHRVLGDRKVILAATPDELRLFQLRYVLPNNAALLVVGDVSSEDVFELAAEAFDSWRAGFDPFPATPVLVSNPPGEIRDTVVVQPVRVAHMVVAWRGPSLGVDTLGSVAAAVFAVLVGQNTSTFQRNLVDSGLVLEAHMDAVSRRYSGEVSISATFRPDNFWEAYGAVIAEIGKFGDPNYFTHAQLINAKTWLRIQNDFERGRASSYAHEIAARWAGAGFDYHRDRLDRLQAVTPEDIRGYLFRYVIGRPRVNAVMVDQQTLRQQRVVKSSLTP